MDSAEVSRYDSAGTTLEQHERETYEYDNSGIRARDRRGRRQY